VTFHGKRRDACEAIIVTALRAVGASVQQLDGAGLPDLLVGYEGRTYLLEVKDTHGKQGRGMKKTATGLRETQERWWASWRGATPIVVTTADEALVAIGALRRTA
jgi:hypothetical protein